jgi:hypothetical protein
MSELPREVPSPVGQGARLIPLKPARSGQRQMIPILNLPLPSPPPVGWEWIEAYRHWVREGSSQGPCYRLTAAGRRALGNEVESWKRFAAALDTVLRTS